MKGAHLRVMQAEPPAAQQRGRQTLARLCSVSLLHSDGLVEHIHATMDEENGYAAYSLQGGWPVNRNTMQALITSTDASTTLPRTLWGIGWRLRFSDYTCRYRQGV